MTRAVVAAIADEYFHLTRLQLGGLLIIVKGDQSRYGPSRKAVLFALWIVAEPITRMVSGQVTSSLPRTQCPLLGVKRTLRKSPRMSAYDPKRTSAALKCCRAA